MSLPQTPLRPLDADGPPGFRERIAVLEIVQQPQRARSCGNADRDRRTLDPPPVLKLDVRLPHQPRTDTHYMKQFTWIVQCLLYSAESPCALLPPAAHGRALVRGNLVANAHFVDLALDGHRGEACYFCFPDLSFSTAGLYRLKFQCAWIDQHARSNSHLVRSLGTMGHQISDVFRVYSAKDFPSMLPMTPISLSLKRQGLWIRGGIQRNRRARRLARASSASRPALGRSAAIAEADEHENGTHNTYSENYIDDYHDNDNDFDNDSQGD
ncbi:velvet factor-domain-containing protein [Myxozyma melibiosi]|uniref:Velvet factor-domain-containing protein n=1 Tax=Myxozyma melibiosi TaxID=54550 RepID=A0ABR1F8L4_9ASCO